MAINLIQNTTLAAATWLFRNSRVRQAMQLITNSIAKILTLLATTLVFVAPDLVFSGVAWSSDSMKVVVSNNLPASTVCSNGNTLSVFVGSAPQQLVSPGGSHAFSGDFSALPGMGIQINNWYWTATQRPVAIGGDGGVQNPDNSGAQFSIAANCSISQNSPPWFGKGIPSYEISTITAASNANGDCVVNISANNYTNAVTPSCCAPPSVGTDTCKSSQWGTTANGLSWPPASH